MISVLIAMSMGAGNSSVTDTAGIFLLALGTISLILGVINFVVALILTAFTNREWMQAFLIGSGILFLIGLGVCGGGLAVGTILG